MALPKAIQRQAEQAAEIEKAMEAQQPPEPAPQQPAEQPQPEGQQEQKAPEAQPKQPVTEATAGNEELWEHKYRSLAGHYQAFSQKSNAQVADLTATVASLTKQIELLTSKQQASQQPEMSRSEERLVTDKDVDAFGEDLINVARRAALEEFQKEFGKREKRYEDKIARLEEQLVAAKGEVGQVAQSQARTTSDMFFERLGQALPNWEAMQATPECQAWLGMRIPGATYTWNDVLVDAAQKFDLSRVMEVFRTFIGAHPQFDQKAAANTKSQAASELQRQVAPTKSKASGSTATPERRAYTGAEYQSESMRQVRLFQSGKYDEAAKLEAELNAALAEGRVRP